MSDQPLWDEISRPSTDLMLRRNNWAPGAQCANYYRVVTGHHGVEDTAIFPHIRASDAGREPAVDRLEAEHLIIHGVIEDDDRAWVAYLRKSPILSTSAEC